MRKRCAASGRRSLSKPAAARPWPAISGARSRRSGRACPMPPMPHGARQRLARLQSAFRQPGTRRTVILIRYAYLPVRGELSHETATPESCCPPCCFHCCHCCRWPPAAQTLRVGLAEDPDVLDPTLARTFVGRVVFAALCDKLFDVDEKLNIVAAARHQLPMVCRRQGAHAETARRRHLSRRREVRRRSGQVQHRAPQDDAEAATAAASWHRWRASTWSIPPPCG